MSRTLHVQPDIPSSRKVHRSLYMLCTSRVDSIHRVGPNRAPLFTCSDVSRDTSAIRIDRRTRVVGPPWPPNANWIRGMEGRTEPRLDYGFASCGVVIWLRGIAD